uniref:Uncharacterized protein n=2 Tax=Oryza TaxID=4527 RepID=A0A679BC66_9ORYZ|nr:hypothetical protein [Oryza barthii]BBF89459.1 hypothetical protein [Oryza glaberrima]
MLVRGGDNQVTAVNYFRYTDVFYIGPVCSDSSSAGRHVDLQKKKKCSLFRAYDAWH